MKAWLGLGGNVGDSRVLLGRAIAGLCADEKVQLLARSSTYRTPPWGVTEQAPFLNLCIAVDTAFTPHTLLNRALLVERKLGRDRAREERWGPRTVDIDILAYEGITLAEATLTLPHPRLFERAFVLVPLAEIAPDLTIDGQSVAEAASKIDQAGIEKLPAPPGAA